MKWLVSTVCSLALLAAVRAETYDETEEGDARLGYITVGSDGSTSITFNATSIQNAVILGLFVLVLGALVLPLFGVSLGSLFGGDDTGSETGYGYGYEQPQYQTGYEQPATGYSTFSKRSIEMVGPVIEALTQAYKKYEN
jgi:hypothetical protein